MPQFGEKPTVPLPPSYDGGGFPSIADEGRNRRLLTPKKSITPSDPLDDMDKPPNMGLSDKDLLQHIGLLMQHGHDPEIKGWFDQKYGAGISDVVLQKIADHGVENNPGEFGLPGAHVPYTPKLGVPLENIPKPKSLVDRWRDDHGAHSDGEFRVPDNAPDNWMPDMDAPGLHIPDALEDMFFGKGDSQLGAKGYLEQMYGGAGSQGLRNINRGATDDMTKEQLDKLYWQLEEMVGKSGIEKLKDIRQRLKKMEKVPQS